MRAKNAALFALLAACGNGVATTNGLKAELRVSGGQFFQGGEAAPNASGPTVIVPQTKTNYVELGQINFQLAGELSPDAAAIAFELQGDTGYWTLPAAPNDDISAPSNLSFNTTLAFNPDTVVPDGGVLVLAMNALDAKGTFGPTTTLNINTTSSFPAGAALVISLSWDTEADLDLHVVSPSGEELWRGNRTLFQAPPFGSPLHPTLAFIRSFGYLDDDSNGRCVIDGRREENAIWLAGIPDGGAFPPPGQYTVRVDTWSMCGQDKADYQVTAYLHGQVVAQTSGESLPVDTRFPNGAGSGLTVMQLVITPDGGSPDAG